MTRDELRDLIERHEATVFPSDYEARMYSQSTDWESVAAAAHEDRGALLELARRLERRLANLELGYCPLCGDPECPAPVLEVLRDSANPTAKREP